MLFVCCSVSLLFLCTVSEQRTIKQLKTLQALGAHYCNLGVRKPLDGEILRARLHPKKLD